MATGRIALMEPVAAVMTRKVVTATTETSVAEIARLLLKNNISAVPVVDDENKEVT
jgi:CBS domain-containing protein